MSFMDYAPLLLQGATALGSMYLQKKGADEARDATLEGAYAQSQQEAANRQFQRKMFDEDIIRRLPYINMGKPSLGLQQEFIDQGQIDLSEMPLYNMQRESGLELLGQEGMDDPYVRDYFLKGLNATEQDASYSRLGDALQLALGQSESAGRGAQNFSGQYTGSLMRGGNALASGAMQADNQRQSMYRSLADQASQIPAWAYYNLGD